MIPKETNELYQIKFAFNSRHLSGMYQVNFLNNAKR